MKQRPVGEHFHEHRQRTVKQEVYADCTQIAMTRLFITLWEADLTPGEAGSPAMRANEKNGLAVVAEHL